MRQFTDVKVKLNFNVKLFSCYFSVFLDDKRNAKISDFGIRQLWEEHKDALCIPLGTIVYMAPETVCSLHVSKEVNHVC